MFLQNIAELDSFRHFLFLLFFQKSTFCRTKCRWRAKRRKARWITRANASNLRSRASSSRNSDSGLRMKILVRPRRNSVSASSALRQISAQPCLYWRIRKDPKVYACSDKILLFSTKILSKFGISFKNFIGCHCDHL